MDAIRKERFAMQIKKLLTTVFASAFLAFAIPASATADSLFLATAYARDNVSFYAGNYYGEEFYGKKVKIDSLKIPVGLACTISTSDKSTAGTLTSADEKTVHLTELHNYRQWTVSLLQNKNTTLKYKRGLFKTGTLKVEALPKLQFQALKKSAKAANGTVTLSVKYKNNTNADITIEGIDLNWSDILFEGEKPAKEKAIEKPDWITKKVTIPAGKSKTVKVKKKMNKKGKLISYDYPKLYFKYKNIYLHACIDENRLYQADYYGTTSFSDFIK